MLPQSAHPPTAYPPTHTQRPAYAHIHVVSGRWHPSIKSVHLFHSPRPPCSSVRALCRAGDDEGVCGYSWSGDECEWASVVRNQMTPLHKGFSHSERTAGLLFCHGGLSVCVYVCVECLVPKKQPTYPLIFFHRGSCDLWLNSDSVCWPMCLFRSVFVTLHYVDPRVL